MVLPALPSPRPTWARTGSWRRYIKTSSNRKLQMCDLDIDVSERRRSVRFQDDADDLESSSSSVQQETPATAAAAVEDHSGSSAEDEKAKRWYAKTDYEAFEKDGQLTALQYRTIKKKGAPFIEREHSVRGLEDLLDLEDSRSNWNMPSCREEHLRLVLEEQSRQKTSGIYPNDTMLREISTKSSREARNRSAALGEADALSGYVSSKRHVFQRQVQGVMHSVSRKIKR